MAGNERGRTTPSQSALAPKLVATVFNWPDHLRVAKWDFFDDRGAAIVRLPSPRNLVSECRETLQRDPLISKFVKKAFDGSDHVLDHGLLSLMNV